MINNNTNKFSSMVIVGLAGSIILAISAVIFTTATINRCHTRQLLALPSATDVGCWYESIPMELPPAVMSFPPSFMPHRYQFSTEKFLNSTEGKIVILLVSGSVGFLALAGFGLKRKTGSSAVSVPPVLSHSVKEPAAEQEANSHQ